MTILAQIQAAAPRLAIEAPDTVFGSSDETARELAEVAREACRYITDLHDWQALKKLETITGDGSTTAFDLPWDYDRMPKKQRLRSSRYEGALCHVTDHDEWLQILVDDLNTTIPHWTILGGQVQFHPAPASGEEVKYYYQNRNVIAPDGGGAFTDTPTADGESFRLDERMLKLAIIWMFKQSRGLDYAEDMAAFETAASRAMETDEGSREIVIGRPRRPAGVQMAYPTSITP